MQCVTNANFAPSIAYLIPGATALFGVSQFSPTLQGLFLALPANPPTIGGFLYLTVVSLAAGMTVSALRWAVVDSVHERTGLHLPKRNFAALGRNVEAFSLLVEIHYKHYLYYANMFVATAVVYACYRIQRGWQANTWGWADLGFVVTEVLFFATSRDTLRRYYSRTEQLLASTEFSIV